MRGSLTALAGLAFLAAACGGSSGGTTGSSSGGSATVGGSPGTTGAAATSGGKVTTGGTSGAGATTGGGATSGGSAGTLPAGSACSSNAQCTSDICGTDGNGHCCATACSADATCGASDCDDSGACTYPAAGTSCGTSSCSDGQLTSQSCDGSGNCASGQPTACANNFGCATGSACDTACATSADCATGLVCNNAACVCNNAACVAAAATGACTENDDCTSNVCGLSGTGDCCTTACTATADPACDPTACDATSGDCVYPAGAACGTPSCTGSNMITSACDALGTCSPNPTACPNNFACSSDGQTCNTTCLATTDCASGFFCDVTAGTCNAQVTTGPCSENDACVSGVCGTNGSGNCCTAACTSLNPPCGATDCDGTSGACDYPAATVTCGTVLESCASGIQQNPSACDGAGNCNLTPGTTMCSPYVCNGTAACFATCTDNTSCASGDFCDTTNSTCCDSSALTGPNPTLAVDSVTGSDATGCCGIGSNGPCATLTQAMKIINAAQVANVTINVAVNGAGGDWAPAGEIYPIVLGWGVGLNASGIYFYDPASPGNAEIFDVNNYSSNDLIGGASIFGSAANQVWIGMDVAGDQSADLSAIEVEAGNTLDIANATVNGSLTAQTTAITVGAGASLVLGSDQASLNTGTVNVGSPSLTDGWTGIACLSAGGLGCSVSDVPLGESSVMITGQENLDIDAEDYASVTLSSGPIIGLSPTAQGFQTCFTKNDALSSGTEAILLHGAATMTFSNGWVQCIAGDGFELLPSANGDPTLTLTNSTVQNTEKAIYALDGTATVSTSIVQFNFDGVEQDTDGVHSGSIDLNGGVGSGNTIICSDSIESVYAQTGQPLTPGFGVLNTTVTTVDASNVTWDTPGPDEFSCNPGLIGCTCESTTCTTLPGVDDMNAVYESTGTITTAGNLLSTVICAPSAPFCSMATPCQAWETCCTAPGARKSSCQEGPTCN